MTAQSNKAEWTLILALPGVRPYETAAFKKRSDAYAWGEIAIRDGGAYHLRQVGNRRPLQLPPTEACFQA